MAPIWTLTISRDKRLKHLSPAGSLHISDKTYLAYKPISEAKCSGDRLTYHLQALKKKRSRRFSRIHH